MQLADEAIVASGLRVDRATARVRGGSERDRMIRCGWDRTVPVSSLDSGAVKDEDEQQQAKAALHAGSLVLKWLHQHAGHCYL